MKITVTKKHISAAKPLPYSSPIALALQELGYENAIATQRQTSFGGAVYALPEVAIAAEIRFDFLAKNGTIQGEIVAELEEYSFELDVKP